MPAQKLNRNKTPSIFLRNFAVFILALFSYTFFFASGKGPVYALNSDRPNNKFGIHFALPHLEDLSKAREMINSNGGDWGYITFVMQENDRDKSKWQEVFEKLRELHLIPIIRLATVPQGDNWKKPNPEDADSWVNFLNSLNWVVKNRYVVLFNEPNHANEWGGNVNATDYAQVVITFAQKLKDSNSDYFLLLAGLDASAPNSLPQYQDEADFLQSVVNDITVEKYNNLFSGLASHSYPNPGFSGSASASGRGSIRNYEWELGFLRQLGIKDLPVFITETGWIRQTQSSVSNDQVNESDAIANNYKNAFANIWLPDNRVIAVTPFVFDYQGEPFLNFSWKKYQQNDFYPQYYILQSLPKIKGEPERIEKGRINADFAGNLVADSNFRFIIRLKNEGETIWDKDAGYQLLLSGKKQTPFEYFFSDLKNIYPEEEADVDFYIKTKDPQDKSTFKIILAKEGKELIGSQEWSFQILPLPSLNFSVSLFPKFISQGDDLEIQIFNNKEELVFRKKNLTLDNGTGIIQEVQNVALGNKYRVVILKPYYLPRQAGINFHQGSNSLVFSKMLPLDFNQNGKPDLGDFLAFLKNPLNIKYFLP